MHKKTNEFKKYTKDDLTPMDHITEYVVSLIHGEADGDYYEDDQFHYYRIYEDDITQETIDTNYHIFYHKPQHQENAVQLDQANNRVIWSWSQRERTEEEIEGHKRNQWPTIREQRNALLAESDVDSGIGVPDYWNSRTQAYRDSWTTYRQALRDIPQTNENPFTITWPEAPSEVFSNQKTTG